SRVLAPFYANRVFSDMIDNPFLYSCARDHPDLHSFPTRRSSDLRRFGRLYGRLALGCALVLLFPLLSITDELHAQPAVMAGSSQDRKSTRLNSSHDQISYAVFCLKKKILK